MILYYESDIRMVGGTVRLIKKVYSLGFYSCYIAEMTIQDNTLPVYMRVYRDGYGIITGIAANNDEEYDCYLDVKHVIDKYLDVCRCFDANWIETNRGHRLAIEHQGTWYGMIASLLALICFIKMLTATAIFTIIWAVCSVAFFLFSIYTLLVIGRKKRNCLVDNNYVDEYVKKGKCISENDKRAVYIARRESFWDYYTR